MPNQTNDVDIQQLRHLIKQAKKEKASGKSPGPARELFRCLGEIIAV